MLFRSVIDEEESKIVKKIFRLYLNGESVQSIAQQLNIQKIPTKYSKTFKDRTIKLRGGFDVDCNSIEWNQATIHSILTNTIYKGDKVINNELHHFEQLQIIDNDVFDKVQIRLKERNTKQGKHIKQFYLLNNIPIICGVCGRNFHKKNNPKINTYLYKCYSIAFGKYKNIPITICSTGIGGPSTAIAMEELVALGAENFIRVGSCGANQTKIKIGDLIISDSVVREDHTCLDYVPLQYPAIADPDIFQIMKKASEVLKFKYYSGTTVTVDALYSKKTKETKEFWKNFNTLAQDMEAGTVLTLARIKGVKAGVVLLVVDQEAEKNIRQKIAKYSVEAQSGKGDLVKMENRASLVALETFVLMSQKIGRASCRERV